MKKILRNNQVIITALAIMIAIAGYLNFSNNNSKDIGMSGEFYEAKKDVLRTISPDSTKDNLNKNTSKKEEKIQENISDENQKKTEETLSDNVDEKQVASTEDDGNIGEAVLVNSNISLDYFYTVKLNREQNRAKSKEELINVVENEALSEKEKEIAVNKIIELTANSERENAAEMMLEAKGFTNSIVSIVDGKADVVVDADTITEEQVAQVVDVVNRKTGISNDKIVVTPVNSKEDK